MKKKNIFISVIVLFSMLLNLTVFSEESGSARNLEAPLVDDLRNEMQLAFAERNKSKIKEIGSRDYSKVVSKTDSITVTIDEDDQWELHKEIFGLQYEFVDNYNTYYEDGKLKQDYIDFNERNGKIPVLRLGGMASTAINFLNVVGPVAQRKPTPETTINGFPPGSKTKGAAAYKMGIPETIKMLQQNNPDAGLLLCISLWCTPPEDIINFAHYLIDDKNESKWGALRAADGIEDPVKIWYWELGNEVDGFGRQRDQWRMDTYIKHAKAAAEAIRSVMPDAKIMVNGPTAPWGDYGGEIVEYTPRSWTSWHMAIMPELVGLVDGIAMHPYYDGYSAEFSAMYFADKVHKDVSKMIEEQDIRNEYGDLKEFEIIITEHNRWSDIGKINNDFQSAMSVSHFYNLAFQRPWLTGSTLHNLQGAWCAFWLTSFDNFVMTPTAKMHKMYTENIGDRVCKSSWIKYNDDGTVYDPMSDPYFERDDFSVVATPNGESELKVVLTNKTAYRNIKVNFEFLRHNYTLVEEVSFKAPNSATFCVDKETEDLVTVTKTQMNIPNCTSYTTPTEGIVILTFKTNDKMRQLGEKDAIADGNQIDDAPVAEEDSFSDISSSYAKNEINALANAGIVTGKDAGIFDPNGNVTRAEFFVMLAKALDLRPYKGTIWSDVPFDTWYSGYANALYIEGIIQGDVLRAKDEISIRELMNIIGWVNRKYNNSAINGRILGRNVNLNEDETYAISNGYFSKILQYSQIEMECPAKREEAAYVIYKISRAKK